MRNFLLILFFHLCLSKALLSGVLRLDNSVNSRVQIVPLARAIGFQMESVSWCLHRDSTPSMILAVVPPSLFGSERKELRWGFFTLRGSFDISQRASLGVSFYSGKWYDDNLLVFSPEVVLGGGSGQRRYVCLRFVSLIGPDDFRYRAQSVTLVQIVDIVFCRVALGIRIEDMDCRVYQGKPEEFRHTMVSLVAGVPLYEGEFVRCNVEGSLTDQFVGVQLAVYFKI